jgi:GT2 family glycosyltransferase
MLVKRSVIEKIGGFDERFGMGNSEDDDFCLRAAKANFMAVIAGDVFIHHFGSKSFEKIGRKNYERLVLNNFHLVFKEKWGATPDEIWLRGKKPTKDASVWIPLPT